MGADAEEGPAIWTVGHSNHPMERFLELLRGAGITVLADVRRTPASRWFPHFNKGALSEQLPAEGIRYLSLPTLGGRREPRPDSANLGWTDLAMRGFADYMEGAAFAEAIAPIDALAPRERVALLCSEGDWRRCHRGLIADWLQVRGATLVHMRPDGDHEPHPFTAPARVVGDVLSYPPPESSDPLILPERPR